MLLPIHTWWVPFGELVFKLNGLLHGFDDKRHVQLRDVLRQDLIQVELGHSTELMGLKLLHLPRGREYLKQTLLP